ncbi:PqqD family protein [Priestia megaterium]|uniref:PqqD family protein n=1 Tax=Priestia megaterium TaxID=1404 RepID=UPI0025B076C8|nr:PqqD family protein [Priestia megaterium]MDN3233554.1 PqqD family protein [Priestia megaterium]
MKVSINKDLIVYEEEGEILLINMKENTFHSLDAISSIIWRKIEHFKKITDVINYIYENSDGEKEVITKDINEFVLNLEKVGVLSIV